MKSFWREGHDTRFSCISSKIVFESWQKKADLTKKKNHFETKNAKFVSFQKKKTIFCFKKLFFVNHFLKRYKLCVVALPSKRFFFLSSQPFFVYFFWKDTSLFLFQNGFFFFEKIQTLGTFLFTPFLVSLRKGAGKGWIDPFLKGYNLFCFRKGRDKAYKKTKFLSLIAQW